MGRRAPLQQSIAVDLALLEHSARLLREVERTLGQTAKQHKAHALSRLPSVPGIGKIVRVGSLSERPESTPFPRGQDVVSYCRPGKCAKEAAGKRYGPSGKKIGHAYLTWAFAEAAVLLLRNNIQGPHYLARVEKPHGQGKALTILAHKVARAVYYMLTRDTVLERALCLNGAGSRVGAPAASLDTHGSSLHDGPWKRSTALRHGTRNRT